MTSVSSWHAPFKMDFRLTEASKPKRVAILASKDDHCLLDLHWRNRRGELDMSVVMVISNHPDLADQVRPFGVPFMHVPSNEAVRDAMIATRFGLAASVNAKSIPKRRASWCSKSRSSASRAADKPGR